MVFLGGNKKKANLFSIFTIIFIVIALGLIAYFSIKQISASSQETPKTKVTVAINNWDLAGQPLFHDKNNFGPDAKFRCSTVDLYLSDSTKNGIRTAVTAVITENKLTAGGVNLTETIDGLREKYNNFKTPTDIKTALSVLDRTAIVNSSWKADGKLKEDCNRGKTITTDPRPDASFNYESFPLIVPVQYQVPAGAPPAATTGGTFACLKISDSVFTTYVLNKGSLWEKLNPSDKGETPVTRNDTEFHYSGAGTGATRQVITYNLKSEEKCPDTAAPAVNVPIATDDSSTALIVKVVDNAGNPVPGASVSFSVSAFQPPITGYKMDDAWNNSSFKQGKTGADGTYEYKWRNKEFVLNSGDTIVDITSADLTVSANTAEKGPVPEKVAVYAGKKNTVQIVLPIGVPDTAAAGADKSPEFLAPVQAVKPQAEKADFPTGNNTIEFRPVRYSEAGFADNKAPIGGVSYTLEVKTTVQAEKDKPTESGMSRRPLAAYAASNPRIEVTVLDRDNKPKGNARVLFHWGRSDWTDETFATGIDGKYLWTDSGKVKEATGLYIGAGFPQSNSQMYHIVVDLGYSGSFTLKEDASGNFAPSTATASTEVATGTGGGAVATGGGVAGAGAGAAAGAGTATKTDETAKPVEGGNKIGGDKSGIASGLSKFAAGIVNMVNNVANLVKPKEKETYIYTFSSKTIDNGVNSRVVIKNLPDGNYKLTLSKQGLGENVFVTSREISGGERVILGDGDIYLVANPGAEPPSAPATNPEIISSIRQDGKNTIHEITAGNSVLGYVDAAAGYGWQKKDTAGKYKTDQPEFPKNSGVPTSVASANTENPAKDNEICVNISEKNITYVKFSSSANQWIPKGETDLNNALFDTGSGKLNGPKGADGKTPTYSYTKAACSGT